MTALKEMPEEFDGRPLSQFLTYRFAQVHAKLNAQAARILNQTSGISLSQWRIIALIGNAVRCRSTDLVKISAIDKGLFSRKLKTLISDGLINATTDKNDHRVQLLSLSEKGMALYNKTLPVMRTRQAVLLNSLDPDEQKALFSAFEKLEKAVDQMDNAS